MTNANPAPRIAALLARHRPANAQVTPQERRLIADAERAIAPAFPAPADSYWTQQAAAMLVIGQERTGASANVAASCGAMLATVATRRS